MPALLCVVAHPDDETILCGGTLVKLASRGVALHFVSLTRGEGGEVGEPPLTDREHLGEVREQEMVCAVQKLGGRSLTFLGYADPVVGPDDQLSAPDVDSVMLAGQIANSLQQFAPQVVLTHGSDGEYGHPAHQMVHRATLAAVASLGESAPLLYSFAATYPDHPYPRLTNLHDPADVVVDVSEFLEQKIAAALCHATQNALFVRRRSQEAGRQLSLREVMLTTEAFHRHWSSGKLDDDPFLRWLE
ncbi:MAG: PIG-L deacetylase family protein [Anaerolineales bacterium]